jgi:hypothetical protein
LARLLLLGRELLLLRRTITSTAPFSTSIQVVAGIGLQHVTQILPWLVDTLKESPGAVERSGAAQVTAQ